MSEAKGVEAVERALTILDAFGPETQVLSLADLARQTGFYKSTILRLAVSLEKFGYLVRGETGLYRLGPAAWRLGSTYRLSFDLGGVLRPELKTLCETTHETASFYIREGGSRLCLYRVEPARAIRHTIEEGARMPLDRGASGKVLLAFSGEDHAEGAAIRASGHAISLGERDAEVAAISVPLLAASGRLVGALAVSGLITRFSAEHQPPMIAALVDCQKRARAQILD